MDDKIDDVMLPGFRFHPTDEELVGFYLKRKIQQRTLPIELIKQVDIYKYDPWDLPKLATTGEKEWYFYCPRDRKYRNSARPNRVTGAGFWKATGTDRPIYSSDGTKCIGLKKSLVFYRGRAAKGLKTDWMMHEFRLPTSPESSPPKKFLDKNLPLNDSWAICRIFKKTSSMANRALSQPWVMSVLSEAASPPDQAFTHQAQFSSENMSSTTKLQEQQPSDFSTLNIPTTYNGMVLRPSLFSNPSPDLPSSFMIPSSEAFNVTTPTLIDESQHFNNFSLGSSQVMQRSMSVEDEEVGLGNSQASAQTNDQWGSIRSMGFPFSLANANTLPDPWKPNFSWDSPPCPPSEISTTYSTTKSYT